MGGLSAIGLGGRSAKRRESGMIKVTMTYRLCSPPRCETVSSMNLGKALVVISGKPPASRLSGSVKSEREISLRRAS